MVRNLIGGKQYKKQKHATEKAKYQEKEDDQLWARVIRILGDRNTLAYCNDNVVRLCHIRGSIRKDTWISVGDIVLISCRDFGNTKEDVIVTKDKYEKGDILYKYDRDYHSKLRKEKDINTKLFLILENASEDDLKRIKQNKMVKLSDEDDDIFDGEADDKNDDDDVDVDNI
jgi:translation initiation factor 1A